QIAALVPIERAEPLQEGGGERLGNRVVCPSHEHAEASQPVALLRLHSKGPSHSRAANHRDKVAPPHWITSSAPAGGCALFGCLPPLRLRGFSKRPTARQQHSAGSHQSPNRLGSGRPTVRKHRASLIPPR